MLATMDSVKAGFFEVLPTEAERGRIEVMGVNPPRITLNECAVAVAMSTERARLS